MNMWEAQINQYITGQIHEPSDPLEYDEDSCPEIRQSLVELVPEEQTLV